MKKNIKDLIGWLALSFNMLPGLLAYALEVSALLCAILLIFRAALSEEHLTGLYYIVVALMMVALAILSDKYANSED